jgi:hypothetical protein
MEVSQLHAPTTLPWGKVSQVRIGYESGSTPEPVCGERKHHKDAISNPNNLTVPPDHRRLRRHLPTDFMFKFSLVTLVFKFRYRLLVGKLEGTSPLGRPRRRCLDNIRMDLVEVGWDDVDWIGLAQDRDRWRALVDSVLNIRVP